MNSYEVVRRAIDFETPDRLPVYCPDLGMSDIHAVRWNQIGTGDKHSRETVDEWGCTWIRSETVNMGQVKGHPLDDWSALAHYQWPDPDNPDFFNGMEALFKGSEGKYIHTDIFMLLFERMQALHGFENTLIDLALGDERIEMLADRIVEFDLQIIHNIQKRFPGEIHCLTFTDDWGMQGGPFVRPTFWQRFFLPRYEGIFSAIHQAGWKVWMHSCGRINDLLDGLIQAGVDVIELQQPRVLGIQEIGDKFCGRVCFASLCDIQQVLPTKNDDEIQAEAKLLLERWSTPQGGFILIDTIDSEAIGINLEKKKVMVDAFLAADPWRKKAAKL
jgi:hypothetical protein